MRLLPKVGLEDVRFGMIPSEVLKTFNERQQYEDWMGDNLNDSLLFHGIIFGFDECNSFGPLSNARLQEIRIFDRKDLILWGKQITQWNKTSLKQYLDDNKIWYQEEVNGDWSCNYLWLALSFDKTQQLEYVEMWTEDENLIPSLKRRIGFRRVLN